MKTNKISPLINVVILAAIDKNFGIGKDNKLSWKLRTDLKNFKELTTNNVIIMGRKTFESIGSKPLPKRANFIITSQLDYAANKGLKDKENTYVVHNLDDALTQAASLAHGAHLETIWIIGGEQVFKEAMLYTDRIELTHVDTDIKDGDAFYPELSSEFETVQKSEQMHDEKSGLDFTFVTYKRKSR